MVYSHYSALVYAYSMYVLLKLKFLHPVCTSILFCFYYNLTCWIPPQYMFCSLLVHIYLHLLSCYLPASQYLLCLLFFSVLTSFGLHFSLFGSIISPVAPVLSGTAPFLLPCLHVLSSLETILFLLCTCLIPSLFRLSSSSVLKTVSSKAAALCL